MRFHSILKIKPSPTKKKKKENQKKKSETLKTVTDLGVGNTGSDAGQHVTMSPWHTMFRHLFNDFKNCHDQIMMQGRQKKKEETHFLFRLHHRKFGFG